jgi:hypothetical protein
MKVLKTYDDFLWLDVTEIARSLWLAQDFELYAIYDDQSEHLINTESEFEGAVNDKCIIAIGLDYINQITLI